MPEGDSVWRAANQLHAALAGQILLASDFRVPRFATADLSGRAAREVVSRGKHLLVRTDGEDARPLPPRHGRRVAPLRAG